MLEKTRIQFRKAAQQREFTENDSPIFANLSTNLQTNESLSVLLLNRLQSEKELAPVVDIPEVWRTPD